MEPSRFERSAGGHAASPGGEFRKWERGAVWEGGGGLVVMHAVVAGRRYTHSYSAVTQRYIYRFVGRPKLRF